MITDFCISLSRKRKDKVEGTGRFHIMKNRYGMDGITYSVKADTSTGHFEVSDYIEMDDDEQTAPQQRQVTSGVDFMTRTELKNKYFELNKI